MDWDTAVFGDYYWRTKKRMKNKIKLIMCAMVLAISLTGCNYANVETTYDPEQEDIQSMFIKIEESPSWYVAYHRETKVMCVVGDNSGNFTLLVDENGKPMLYE